MSYVMEFEDDSKIEAADTELNIEGVRLLLAIFAPIREHPCVTLLKTAWTTRSMSIRGHPGLGRRGPYPCP